MLCRAIIIFLLLTAIGIAEPIKVHTQNPRYLTDDSGSPIYLTGSHTWELIHYAADDPNPKQLSHQRMEDFLDYTQGKGLFGLDLKHYPFCNIGHKRRVIADPSYPWYVGS